MRSGRILIVDDDPDILEVLGDRLVSQGYTVSTARDGVEAMMDGRYPGKVVIFPQLSGLPLTGVDELKEKLPEVASMLVGGMWTLAAEQKLLELYS